MTLRCALLSALAAALAAAGCNNSSSSSSLTPSPTLTTEVLTGTVQPPVAGVLQSASNPFVVGQSGGSVSATLTSAVETLPGGTLLPTVTMGLGIGAVANGTCTLLANAFATAQAGSTAQLSGTLAAGNYCVQVSDVSNQLGPVAYAVAVTHP